MMITVRFGVGEFKLKAAAESNCWLLPVRLGGVSAATRESYSWDDDLSVLYPDIFQSKIMKICRDRFNKTFKMCFYTELYLGYRNLITSFNSLSWIIRTARDLTFSLKLKTFPELFSKT